jgi:putative ABC transport system ATP-binding protein
VVEARNRLTSLYVEPERASVEAEPPALELIDVFKIFRTGSTETVALRGLNLKVEPRETLAVVGPSGSGKSTMLSLAAAMDVPSAGDVRIDGRSLARLDENELARIRGGQIAVVFQSDNLWPTLSARENVAAAVSLAHLDRDPIQAAEEALAIFGLENRSLNTPGQLSGGEQQRVAIAAAAARRPRIVFADEPTGELDSANEEIVLKTLGQLRDTYSSAVVLITHSPTVAKACDRVIHIADGRVSE